VTQVPLAFTALFMMPPIYASDAEKGKFGAIIQPATKEMVVPFKSP